MHDLRAYSRWEEPSIKKQRLAFEEFLYSPLMLNIFRELKVVSLVRPDYAPHSRIRIIGLI